MYLRTWKDARKYREFLLIDDDGNIFDDVRNPEIFSQRIPFPQFEWENDLSLETWILNFVNTTHKIHLKWSVLTVKRFGRISTWFLPPWHQTHNDEYRWNFCWNITNKEWSYLRQSRKERVTLSWYVFSSHFKGDENEIRFSTSQRMYRFLLYSTIEEWERVMNCESIYLICIFHVDRCLPT